MTAMTLNMELSFTLCRLWVETGPATYFRDGFAI
jgi:hypothetical protein